MQPAAIAARTFPGTGEQALARVAPLLALMLLLSAVSAQQPPPDHPLYARSTCPTRLWQPSEVPRIHEIGVSIDPADFRFMLDHQAALFGADPNARDMNLTSITFDGQVFAGGHFKVHGGKYQRGQGHWDGEPGRNGEVDPENSQHGGDCYRRDDPAAEFTCKPSFRIKFDKDGAPFNSVFDTLFRYPADKQGCNNPAKFTLNGNWNVSGAPARPLAAAAAACDTRCCTRD
jgi:hypothetical protein